MQEVKISYLLSEKISGEWGQEYVSGNDGINVIRTANFTNSGKISFTDVVKREIDSKIIQKKQLLNGDIIIEKSGGSSNQPVGRVVYFENPNDEPYLCNNFTALLRPDKSKISPKYLFYLLFYNYQTNKVLSFQNKTTGIINLQLERYLDSVILFEPDLETQNKIVAILDKAQVIIDKREKNIQKYGDLLRATFLDMFGDVPNNPKGFKKVALKEFGEIITGNTPSRNDLSNYDSQFIEWIKTDNIIYNSHILTPAAEFLSQKGLKKGRCVKENSLLVTCIAGSIGSIGRSAITDRKVAFNQQINAIVPNKDVSVFFLYWMFKVSSKYIQSFATGGMKRLLTKGEFEKILFLKPNYEDQLEFEKIAIHYSKIQHNSLSFLNQAETLLKSLSQQVFGEKISIDIDAELEALINAIDLEKKDEENKIDTIKDTTFTQRLIDRLEAQEFESSDQYNKAKYILFRIMKEEKNLVKQVFKDNRLLLTLLNEIT